MVKKHASKVLPLPPFTFATVVASSAVDTGQAPLTAAAASQRKKHQSSASISGNSSSTKPATSQHPPSAGPPRVAVANNPPPLPQVLVTRATVVEIDSGIATHKEPQAEAHNHYCYQTSSNKNSPVSVDVGLSNNPPRLLHHDPNQQQRQQYNLHRGHPQQSSATPTTTSPSPSSASSGTGGSNSTSPKPQHKPPQPQPPLSMRSLSSASGSLYLSAPGKVILFGEHAVVYGRTAIAGSIDLRTYLRLNTSADGRIYLCLPDMNIERTWDLAPLQRELSRLACDPAMASTSLDEPPPLDIIVPLARKLSGSCEDQSGVQHLAILAFWYLLIGICYVKRKRLLLELHDNVNNTGHRRHNSGSSSGSDNQQEQQNDDGDNGTTLGRRSQLAPGSSSASARDHPYCGRLFDAQTKDLLAVKLTIRFKLPSCVGLGSSGAYCVCIAAALLQTSGLIPEPNIRTEEKDSCTWDEAHLDAIRRWSATAESLIHGRASGLDAAICTYGGVASYTPGKRIENLQHIPDLKVILINSRVERNTSRMVQTVKDKLKKYPAIIESIFDTIDTLSIEAARVLQRPSLCSATIVVDSNDVGGSVSNLDENMSIACGMMPASAASSVARMANGPNSPHSLQPTSSAAAGINDSLFNYPSTSRRSPSVCSSPHHLKRGSNASAVSSVSASAAIAAGGTESLLQRQRAVERSETIGRLNELARINNQLLIALGTGHARVDQICTLLGRYGIHPKMTGAGGGGCLFAFMKPHISQTVLNMIRDELLKEGYEMYQPMLGGSGVLCHQRQPDVFAPGATPRPSAASNSISIGVPPLGSSSTTSSSTTTAATVPPPPPTSGRGLAGLFGGGGSGGTATPPTTTTPTSSQQSPAVKHKKKW